MPRRLAPILLATALLTPVAAARADWTAPVAVTPATPAVSLLGAGATGDQPAILDSRRLGRRRVVLELRTATRAGGPLGAPVTVATSDHTIESASGGALGGGPRGDHSAAWLQIIGGVRRPVVATGPRLADHRVLATNGRSTQILAFAANRLGDAVVAFWRYAGQGYEVLAAYRPAGQPFGAAQVVGTGQPGFPTVTIDEGGRAAVGWPEDDGLHVAERPAGAGAVWAPDATLPGSAGVRNGQGLALGLDLGRAVAAWTRPGQPGDVVVADRAAGQAAWSAPVVVSPPGTNVRSSSVPAVSVDRDVTVVAWVRQRPRAGASDTVQVATRRGDGAWGAPATVDPGLGGARAAQAALLAPALGRPALLVAGGFDARQAVTATIRPDGSVGPRRTIPIAGGTLGRLPLAAQGARSTWLALPRTTRAGADVLLARSR